MIIFLNRAGPIHIRRSALSRLRTALLALRKKLSRPGGAASLQHNLQRELALQTEFHWSVLNGGGEPANGPIDIAWVLSSRHDLACAIGLKQKGLVRHLWAGPNMVVVPQEREQLLQARDIDSYIVPCAWVADFYASAAPYLKNKLCIWPVGIDTEYWRDDRHLPKPYFLIYSKNQPALAQDILRQLTELRIPVKILNYGAYTPDAYREALRHAQGMIWLSRSETQGLACLEALSMNVPVVAWDPGQWLYDSPSLHRHFSAPASSIPYFDAACGESFKTISEFSAAFQRFRSRLATYQPRAWLLKQNLDLASNLRRLEPLHAV